MQEATCRWNILYEYYSHGSRPGHGWIASEQWLTSQYQNNWMTEMNWGFSIETAKWVKRDETQVKSPSITMLPGEKTK